MVSYEIAMGLAIISAVLMTSLQTGTGTLSMIGIVEAQLRQHTWFVFKFFPLGLIAFVVFAIAMVAETNRAPFDLPEAESELVAGFHTEYSGFRWSLFFLAEYAAMFAVSVDRSHALAGRMAAALPESALSGTTWDLAFSLVPGAHVRWCSAACASLAQCACRSIRAVADPDHWPGGLRRCARHRRTGAVCCPACASACRTSSGSR